MNTIDVSAKIATLILSQTQYKSFETITKIAGLDAGYNPFLEQNEKCKNFLFSPITNTKPEKKIVLFWGGKDLVIPGGLDIYDYFNSEGCEVIENPHCSLLINSMGELTEDKLTELGLPNDVNIVLPVAKDTLLMNENGDQCFPGVVRSGGRRYLNLFYFKGKWGKNFAFFLHERYF